MSSKSIQPIWVVIVVAIIAAAPGTLGLIRTCFHDRNIESMNTSISILNNSYTKTYDQNRTHTKYKQKIENYNILIDESDDEAEKRKYRDEKKKLIEEYNNAIDIMTMLEPIEDLKPVVFNEKQIIGIKEVLSKEVFLNYLPRSTKAVGYIVIGDYQNSIDELNFLSACSIDQKMTVLKAVAYSGLASRTDNIELKDEFIKSALNYYFIASDNNSNYPYVSLNESEMDEALIKLLIAYNLKETKLFRVVSDKAAKEQIKKDYQRIFKKELIQE